MSKPLFTPEEEEARKKAWDKEREEYRQSMIVTEECVCPTCGDKHESEFEWPF